MNSHNPGTPRDSNKHGEPHVERASAKPVQLCFLSHSPGETERLGQRLGVLLQPGDGVSLIGELGAGKTCFVRGLARGLGIDAADEVRSPTWMLMLEYEGPVPLLHLDAYFEGRTADFLEDGLEARLAEEGVLVVEWGEKLRHKLPQDFLKVHLEHLSEGTRRIVLVLEGAWVDRIGGELNLEENP